MYVCMYMCVCMYIWHIYIYKHIYICVYVCVWRSIHSILHHITHSQKNWCVTCYNHVVTMIYGNYSAHQQPRCALDWHRLGQVLRKKIGRNDWLQIHMGPWCTWSWCSELRLVAYWMNIIIIYVCMYACMHACMYACMHACMHACMSMDGWMDG
jgi:hypothetical protein